MYKKREGKKEGAWSGPRYVQKRKVCPFCANKAETIDYKDANKLGRYLTDRARIVPRRRSGVCARHQRALATALKRARHLALLPFVPAHMRMASGTGIGRE